MRERDQSRPETGSHRSESAGKLRRALGGGVAQAGLLAAVSFGAIDTAAAQATPSPTADAAVTDELVVTGTRLARRDYTSASPIVTVDAEEFEQIGAVTVDKLLNSLPQFQPNFTANSNNPANNGIITANLRGLGASRTLVLVDGKRVTPSNASGNVDLSLIPTALVQSVEVITGGASAVYGSDAVAGVVNFRLKNKVEGLEVSGRLGETDYDDGRNSEFSAIYGWQDPQGRGGVVTYASYLQQDPILADNRRVTRDAVRVTGNAAGLPVVTPNPSISVLEGGFLPVASNAPSQAVVNSVFAGYGVAAGRVNRLGLFNFNPDGTLYNGSSSGSTLATTLFNYRGPGPVTSPYGYDTNDGGYLTLDQSILNLGLLGDWQVADGVEAYTRIAVSRVENTRQLSPAQNSALTVPVTNPFIPTDLRTILASRPNSTAPFTLVRRYGELGFTQSEFINDYYQLLGGVRGEIFKSWKWDANFSFGKLEQDNSQPGSFQVSRAQQLLNAADGGVAACGGFNVFGAGKISQGCAAFIAYTPQNSLSVEQTNAEATITGNILELPAGPLSAVFGVGYRKDSFAATVDPNSLNGDVAGFSVTAAATSGETTVSEAFTEVGIPLLKEISFVHSLEATVGYRYADYEFGGGVEAYKGELVYAPFDGLTFRASYDRAVRAANISELFLPQTPSNFNLSSIGGDPCAFNSTFRSGTQAGVDPAQVRALCIAQGISPALIDTFTSATLAGGTSGGNPRLEPEVADSVTWGAVFRSPFKHSLLSGFSGSIDFYDIKIEEAISAGTSGNSLTAVARCYNLNGANAGYSAANEFCGFFGRDATTGAITGLQSTFNNVSLQRFRGIDMQAEYSVDVSDLGGPAFLGQFTIRTVVSRLLDAKQQTLAGDPTNDVSGTINTGSAGAYPALKAATTAQLDGEHYNFGIRWRFIDGMSSATLLTAPTSTASIGTPDYDYFDVFGAWKVNDKLAFNAGVNNIADKDPPLFSNGQVNTNTNASVYDIIGRQFFVRANYKF